MKEDKFEGTGGVTLYYRSWTPLTSARAAVVIVHGFNSHSGQYAWAAEQFKAHGLAVYALDLRGRGKSGGERFFVDDIGEYVADVAQLVTLVKQREPGLPLFLLGHSAGGVVACNYALDHQPELAGLICESFAQEVPAPQFALSILRVISKIAPHARVFKLHNKDFSRNPDAVAELDRDPLIFNEKQPAKTVAAMMDGEDRLNREYPNIKLPVFILHGTLDKATKPSGSEHFYERAGSPDKTLKLYPGHFHDLLNDTDKELVMDDIQGWIDRHLPRAPLPEALA